MKQPLLLLILLLGSGAGAGAAPITFTNFDGNHSTIGFQVPRPAASSPQGPAT
jgi:hypothetical protein